MKKNVEELLRTALLETGMVYPLSSERVFAGCTFLCRQVPGQEAAWIQTVDRLLRWETEQTDKTNLFIARRYLLKEGKMVFGWFLKFSGPNRKSIVAAAERLVEVLKRPTAVAPTQIVQAPQVQSSGALRPQTGGMKVVRRETGEDGQIIEETEMRLPHVPSDLNVPTKPVWSPTHGRYIGGGKGATFSTGGGRR